MRDYELILIISPEVADEELGAIVDRVTQFITERNGIISSVEQWGKKRLAYPIKHFTEGNYVLVNCRFRSTLSKELEARLHIAEEIIRHLLIRLDS
ncbi:MAG: 30S ribosomal protein S6 [Dehalococcoidales bacterium]|nr:30S ribosomal protein S6 [Dehalococcoidales bacterium]